MASGNRSITELTHRSRNQSLLACRQVRDLHNQAARDLGVEGECFEQIDHLLNQLQQLLVGISIMQVVSATKYSISKLSCSLYVS